MVEKLGKAWKLRLVFGTEVSDKRFLVLSYCWGDSSLMRGPTIESNLPEHVQNTPFEDLANTLQDAVVTTHAIGLRYL